MGISSSAGGPATPGAAGTPGKSVFTPEQMASLGIEQGASSPSRGRSDAPAARTPGTTPAQPVKITLQTPEGEPVQLPTSERLSRQASRHACVACSACTTDATGHDHRLPHPTSDDECASRGRHAGPDAVAWLHAAIQLCFYVIAICCSGDNSCIYVLYRTMYCMHEHREDL